MTDLREADFTVEVGDEVRLIDNDWITGEVTAVDGGLGRCCAFVVWSDGSKHWHKVYTLRDVRAHCAEHVIYEPTCVACVDVEMSRRGFTACGHTVEEGCTGHGDF